MGSVSVLQEQVKHGVTVTLDLQETAVNVSNF